MQAKLKKLKQIIAKLESVVVGFSGGVDSTFLLKVCLDVLGKDSVVAVTAHSPIRFEADITRAQKIAEQIGVKHSLIYSREMEDEKFLDNGYLRCYYCKNNLYGQLQDLREKYGFENIVDGTNYEELKQENRPGLKALKELNIKMPLAEVELYEEEIRRLSRQLELPTWDQKSDTCLATRFSRQLKISKKNLELIKNIEIYLRKYNFEQLRARLHDEFTVRLEVSASDMIKVIKNRKDIYSKIKSYGITYVTLDIEGYRSGSTSEGVIYDE